MERGDELLLLLLWWCSARHKFEFCNKGHPLAADLARLAWLVAGLTRNDVETQDKGMIRRAGGIKEKIRKLKVSTKEFAFSLHPPHSPNLATYLLSLAAKLFQIYQREEKAENCLHSSHVSLPLVSSGWGERRGVLRFSTCPCLCFVSCFFAFPFLKESKKWELWLLTS